MNTASKSPSLLVVGGPNVGKTVYGSQVLARLRRAHGKLALRGPPANIAPFELALGSLSRGLAPEHTGAATYHELVLPCFRALKACRLIWCGRTMAANKFATSSSCVASRRRGYPASAVPRGG